MFFRFNWLIKWYKDERCPRRSSRSQNLNLLRLSKTMWVIRLFLHHAGSTTALSKQLIRLIVKMSWVSRRNWEICCIKLDMIFIEVKFNIILFFCIVIVIFIEWCVFLLLFYVFLVSHWMYLVHHHHHLSTKVHYWT
jgi:hypothetical protein